MGLLQEPQYLQSRLEKRQTARLTQAAATDGQLTQTARTPRPTITQMSSDQTAEIRDVSQFCPEE